MSEPLCEQGTELVKPVIPPTFSLSSGLSEWRVDPLTGRQVRIAEARAERPSDFSLTSDGEAKTACPFCVGGEAATPHEIDRVSGSKVSGDKVSGGKVPGGKEAWLSRVVPNRYPAVEGADGVQEVIIESPEHKTRFIDLTPAEATAAVTLWIRRLVHWQQDGQFDYLLLFKNEGAAAGASLTHTHTQLLALPEAPPIVRDEWLKSTSRIAVPQECLIACEEGFTLFCPSAPRFAGESWILPPSTEASREGGGSLAQFLESPSKMSWLAVLLQRLIAAVTTVSRDPAYNLVFQIPLVSAGEELADRWRIEVIPRNSIYAGFELATGLGVNAVSPEAATKQLRAAWNGR